MALKVWGIALLALGIVVMGAGLYGVFEARSLWRESDAACAGSSDDWCGAGETYAAAALLVLSPIATLGGAILAIVGGILVAVSRWLDDATQKVLDAAATYLEQ